MIIETNSNVVSLCKKKNNVVSWKRRKGSKSECNEDGGSREGNKKSGKPNLVKIWRESSQ